MTESYNHNIKTYDYLNGSDKVKIRLPYWVYHHQADKKVLDFFPTQITNLPRFFF